MTLRTVAITLMTDIAPQWTHPVKPPPLGLTDVHVWRISLADPQLPDYREVLSADELARGDHFRRERDSRRFTRCRGVLREMLGRYAGMRPDALAFQYGPHGKPSLPATEDGQPLYFNLSHADDLALLAITRVGEVGIDVERDSPDIDCAGIAASFFTPREAETLAHTPPSLRRALFFTWWVRKEALAKGHGDGMHRIVGDLPETAPGNAEWSLYDLRLAPDTYAALAIRGRGCQIRYWEFHP